MISKDQKKNINCNMYDASGYFSGLPRGTTPVAVTTNKNIKMSSFKSSETIQKKEDGSDSTVTNNQFSSVTLNERKRKSILFEFQRGSQSKD